MPTFLDRYLAGEHEPVTAELTALDERALAAVNADATAVAEEIVRRCIHNFELIRKRLIQLDYQFSHPDKVLVLADENANQIITKIEGEFGPLPLLARVWYTRLSCVIFAQAKEQQCCNQVRCPPAADICGLGSHISLCFFDLPSAAEAWNQYTKDHEEDKQYNPDWKPLDRFLPLGATASNCEPKVITTGKRIFDAFYYNDGGGEFKFLDELRFIFAHGGFPLWGFNADRKNFYIPFEYTPNFKKILPALREGLLPI